MKNYPNQAVDLWRFRRTLDTIADLAAAGMDVNDDGVLGYELARRRAYTFRYFDYSAANLPARLATRIADEQAKPSGQQGARTNAREMRRLLKDLGWLSAAGLVSDAGEEFRTSDPDSIEESDRLASALWDLDLPGSIGVSHPARILLRLLASAPSVGRAGLELALEADNDSAVELARVVSLYGLSEAARRAQVPATDTQVANAKKIFPALAVAAGLVDRVGQTYSLSSLGREFLALPPGAPARSPALAPRRLMRAVPPEEIAARLTGALGRNLTAAEQEAARAALAARAAAHQSGVKALALCCTGGGSLFEGAPDLVWVPDDPAVAVLLCEFKTIVGDAQSQVRHAVGQLLYYRHFDVGPAFSGRDVVLAVVVDNPIPIELGAFLEDLGIGHFELAAGGALRAMNGPANHFPACLART